MQKVPPFNAAQLTSIAKIIGDTDEGLIGSEIDHLLRECRIPNPDPKATKWKRLYNAFVEFQNQRQFGNHVIVFVNKVMDPANYTSNPLLFASRRDSLNAVLVLAGCCIGEDGKARWSRKAQTLDEAMARAGRLRSALLNRGVHDDVLDSCRAELLQENYFHAVFEAMKSIAAKLRRLSGLDGDGAPLAQATFGGRSPVLRINGLATETERGEQRGFTSLLVGLFGTIRNPLAHEPKLEWEMSEQDALDIMTLASLVHRKLDTASRSP